MGCLGTIRSLALLSLLAQLGVLEARRQELQTCSLLKDSLMCQAAAGDALSCPPRPPAISLQGNGSLLGSASYLPAPVDVWDAPMSLWWLQTLENV